MIYDWLYANAVRLKDTRIEEGTIFNITADAETLVMPFVTQSSVGVEFDIEGLRGDPSAYSISHINYSGEETEDFNFNWYPDPTAPNPGLTMISGTKEYYDFIIDVTASISLSAALVDDYSLEDLYNDEYYDTIEDANIIASWFITNTNLLEVIRA